MADPLSSNKSHVEGCSASTELDGFCYSIKECQQRGGKPNNRCQDLAFVCCTFELSCGDATSERVTYFQSPGFPAQSMGTLACDYDIIVRDDTCAVRLEYTKVQLAGKLGGVCDIDQIFILNSLDGPTTGQCGPLSGYSIPERCGHKELDSKGTSASPTIFAYFPYLVSMWYDVKWQKYGSHYQDVTTWWKFPEPIFNTFYYGTTKKHLQQESSYILNLRRQKVLKQWAEKRIVGGTDAELHEFPWQVAIFLDDLFFCGGALINDQFVLTAAHCLMTRDTPIEDLVVQLGDHDLTSPNETDHVTRGVEAVLFHSHFHPFLLTNDIALLHLDEPVAFSRSIQPVCLPDPGEMYTGRRSEVVGWGITAFPMGEPSPVLQKLEVDTLSNYQCSRIIEEPIGLGMLCAAPSSLQGTCFGDSGGPLTTEDPDGSHVLIGVVSFGVTGCAVIPAFPDLYTRVSEYLKWIAVSAVT
ncbi:hypothetical protein B7P43_G12389 [Cryptotermes secundus]|uniref:limulus clotting factor C n=1 Tax=Cryptotermes secundus TaxID=105785 RepID=A0A2J7RBN4_9NEOP|nr:hypothetical protein B7P43_G12389 [Cryptotermes secundus]